MTMLEKYLAVLENTLTLKPPAKVVVGMSGGVDSAVSAFLLKELGFDVVGLFMKNWEEGEECPAEQDWQDVVQTASRMNIPCFSISFAKQYQDLVFEEFLEELKKGHTPNPDILCNREIKFKHLLAKAQELNAEALATGHYARHGLRDGQHLLLRGLDRNKDQTYFLSAITQEALTHSIFPVGSFLKPDIRKIAEEAKIPVAKKKDSTGICFIGKRDFRPFVGKFLGFTPGKMVTPEGKNVGVHQGVALYTIGQRKGLGIGGTSDGSGDAWFVVGKVVEENLLIVAQGENHPALFKNSLEAEEPSWIAGYEPALPLHCTAKIRYRQEDTPCVVTKSATGNLHVQFEQPQRAITSRQSVVFYLDDVCLGGAFIK